MIKRSAAIANMRTKALDRKRGNAIVNACDKILAGKYQDQFVVDMINSGAGTAFNMNTNEVVANIALKILHKGLGQYKYLHPNDHVNTSQSSNDTFPTAMHVAILFAIRDTLPAINKLINSLGRKAKQFSSYKKVGRTHLMDALPVTLGNEFASYTTALTVARDGIVSAKKELEKVALGGTAVGTGANTPRGYRNIAITELAKKSKLPLRPQQDMQYALQSRYAVANMSSALKNFSVELSKIANDIRLMASTKILGKKKTAVSLMPANKTNTVKTQQPAYLASSEPFDQALYEKVEQLRTLRTHNIMRNSKNKSATLANYTAPSKSKTLTETRLKLPPKRHIPLSEKRIKVLSWEKMFN